MQHDNRKQNLQKFVLIFQSTISIDNIVMERFFKTLKYNCIFINEFNNISELREGINIYVDKYNNRRFHSSIGYKKPMDVYLNALQNAA
ncbi:integrase (plasmid) [Candidatus Megaera polyxenophila]|nr:integrase [Candidatus Megaera polyxenophila]